MSWLKVSISRQICSYQSDNSCLRPREHFHAREGKGLCPCAPLGGLFHILIYIYVHNVMERNKEGKAEGKRFNQMVAK